MSNKIITSESLPEYSQDREGHKERENVDSACLYSDDPPPNIAGVTETLSTQEMLIAQKEASINASESQRWEGQEVWQGRENEEMRMVNVMHCEDFIRKLQNAGVKCKLNNFTVMGRIGITVERFGIRNGTVGYFDETVTTLQFPWSYEYTIMRFNEYNVPTNEKYRGWRTAILMLIAQDVITEEQAHKIFGNPTGQAASQYYKELYQMRQAKLGVIDKESTIQ